MTTTEHDHTLFQDAETPQSFDHGAISRFNAWFFTAFDGYLNLAAKRHKQRAFEGLAAPVVVEIGAGTGANLRHLAPGTHLIAVEPSRAMHGRLRQRCEASGVELTLIAGGAEEIPLPDGSVDEVIASLVLCTVQDPQQSLAEIRRILRPGGRFRFVEHVAAPRRGLRRAVQRALHRPWSYLFEGCDPARHTIDAVSRAGFTEVRTERKKLARSLFWPVNTAAWGIAVR
jgi:ubiquinone/menaquinone biosynthesis C-methylase UbiE